MPADWEKARKIYDGLPATITLEITNQDIAAGVRCSVRECPEALAGNRVFIPLFPDVKVFVTVNGDSLHIYAKEPAYGRDYTNVRIGRYYLSDDAVKFVCRFDAGKRVKPSAFKIHKPGTGPIFGE